MHFTKKLRLLLTALLLIFFVVACDQAETETPEATEKNANTNVASNEPEAESESDSQASTLEFVPVIDNENGLSLQYPVEWVTHSASGGFTVASSEDIIQAESLADIGDNAFVVIIPGEIDVFNFQTSQSFTSDDILQALETYKILLEREGQSYVVVEPPQAFTKEGQNMARMVLRSSEDGEPIITVMAVIMGESYMALVSAASNQERAEELRPVFYQIIDSIEVQPPGSFTTEE